jgi:hypothetical protein
MDEVMPIKFYNPTSPGRRQGSVIDYKAVITYNGPVVNVWIGLKNSDDVGLRLDLRGAGHLADRC